MPLTCSGHGGSDWDTHLCMSAQRHIDATGLTGASGSKLKKSFQVNDHGLGEQEEVAISVQVKIP